MKKVGRITKKPNTTKVLTGKGKWQSFRTVCEGKLMYLLQEGGVGEMSRW